MTGLMRRAARHWQLFKILKTLAITRIRFEQLWPRLKSPLALLAGVTAAITYSLALWRIPDLMPHAETQQDRHDARLLVISVGGAIVVITSLLYTARNYQLAHRGQVTDRFVKALEQLGSDEPHSRIGAVYALEHVMRDSARHHNDVSEVLAAFVRHDAPASSETGPLPDKPDREVQAALTALTCRPYRVGQKDLDLSGVHLAGAVLCGPAVNLAYFRDANRADTRFRRKGVIPTDLEGANLTGAILGGGVRHKGAVLTEANLRGADLTGALIIGVDLSTARGLTRDQIASAYTDEATMLPPEFA
jgi:hypothetical protein